MKHLLLVILVLFSWTASINAQYVYTIKADSVKLTGCDSSELIIENHTQNVPGFLYNKGNGRTAFKRGAQKLNDSSYLVGADTVVVPVFRKTAWVQGGNAFGANGVLGTMDNNDLGLYANGLPRMWLFNSGNVGIGINTDEGYLLDVHGIANFAGAITARQGAEMLNPLFFNGSGPNNIIYADVLTFTTGHPQGNQNPGVYIFTNQPAGPNTGTGPYRLIHVNKLVNRGSEDGEETAIRVEFSVTGTASDLRAFHAANGNIVVGTGNVQVGDSTGSTSRVDITGANGFSQLRLRTQYTPTSSSDTNGNPGDIAVDDNYLYYKTSTGWKRTALGAF
jgi:hypothetical protein